MYLEVLVGDCVFLSQGMIMHSVVRSLSVVMPYVVSMIGFNEIVTLIDPVDGISKYRMQLYTFLFTKFL